MIYTKTLVRGLAALISFDIILTLLAVGYLGATELNVLSSILGFAGFIVFKLAASLVAVYLIYRYCLPACPVFTRTCVWMLTLVYGGFCIFNTYQIAAVVV